MNELTKTIFKNELTEKGIQALQARFPKDLIVDMSDDEQFKGARKTRAELNKLLDSIKRRRIDVSKEITDAGNELSERVTEIYSVVVDPFEAEDKKRKIEAERVAKLLQERLNSERQQINGFRRFINDCRAQNSDQVSSAIDALTNVDCMEFHKDIVHEAAKTKEEVLAVLGDMLTSKISLEAAEAQRKELEKNQAIDRDIAEMRMLPMDFIQSSSRDINQAIDRLKSTQIKETVFGARHDEAQQALNGSLEKLATMASLAANNEADRAAAQQAATEAEERKKRMDEAEVLAAKKAAAELAEAKDAETVKDVELKSVVMAPCAAKARPTGGKIIEVLSDYFHVDDATVVEWLCELDLSDLVAAA